MEAPGATDVYFVLHRLYRQGERGIRQRGDAGGYWALQFRLRPRRGIFFAAYALFGIPANLILNKIGAQKWLSITTALWGVLSALTGLVQTETQFIVLRFLLGLGEAGFYPGILLLASIYFPNKVRASVVGIFVLGVPLALTLGSPISGALLEMHGFLGKPGWFWMFFIEGIPAVIMGIFAWFWLDDTPAKARFLNDEEKKR